MRKPRIIISTPDPNEGLAKYAAELAAAVAHTGVETVLFCPVNFEFKDTAEAAGATIANAPDRTVTPASLFSRIVRNLVFAVKSAAAQSKLTRRGDVVHFQNPLHFPLGFVSYALVWLKRGSIVLTAHDPLPHRWRLPGPLALLERAMLGWSYRLVDAIVVHNAPGKQILTDVFGVKAERVRVIPHGPAGNPDAFAEYPDFQALRLLAFGEFRRNKGLHLAIGAVQVLKNRLSVPVLLTIRGKPYNAGESGYWDECQSMIDVDPAGIDVELGYVPESELPGLMGRHHLTVLPYGEFYSESGVAALSLSHRRPLLATTAGGFAEMLEKFGCGIAIENYSQAAVEQAIRTAVEAGREQLEQMGISGEKALRTLRSWDSIGCRTVGLYCDLLHIDHFNTIPGLVETGQDN